MAEPVAFQQVAPVFPVRNVRRALELYRRLGFEADAYREQVDDDAVYGFLERGPVAIHLARVAELDPAVNRSACYLYVADAPAIYAAWKAAVADGRFTELEDMPYGLREFQYTDPDGNQLRVGSNI